jgi:hypothetical protein
MQQEAAAGRQGAERDLGGAGGAQEESNNAPDLETTASSGGSEGFDQDLSGEEPIAAPTAPDPPALGDLGGQDLNYTRVVDPWDALPRGTVEQEDGEGVDVPPGLGDLGGQDLNYTRVVDPWDTPPPNAATPDVAAPDAAVGGAAVGAAGDGLSIGETIEEASGPILDPPADTGAGEATAADETTDFTRIDKDFGVDSGGDVWVNLDYVAEQNRAEALRDTAEDVAEDVGESTVDFVEGIPFVGEDIGDALRDGYDVVEDVVDHADDPVVEDVDPWG